MMKMIWYEFAKIWKKRQFLVLLLVILLTNILLHWYANRETEFQPSPGSYKKVAQTMDSMTEAEKLVYLQTMADNLESIRVTDQIATWLGRDENAVEDLSAEYQKIFKEWYSVYKEGKYLTYTDSLEQEIELIDELYGQAKLVTHYGEYLEEMQQSQDELSGISIFAESRESKEDTFATKNIQKSQEDYRDRTGKNVRWMPSKGPVSVMDSPITGILSLISIFLLAIWTIMEEKEKKLFFITRVTDRGILHNILARMAALGMSCLLLNLLLYGSSYLFYGIATGFFDLSRDIQSVAEYMQSSYNLTIGQFMLCSLFTKAAVGFGFGLLLQFITILSYRRIVPFVAGILVLAGNVLLYGLFPAVGLLCPFKYLNFIGLFHTENLYGDYMNFNIGGVPVSRTGLSLLLLAILCIAGCVAVMVSFCRGGRFYLIQRQGRRRVLFRAHNNLFRHECYKLFVTNRGLLILLACLLLAGGYYTSHSYTMSVREEYYKDLMMKLEGELTTEKETVLFDEKERYDNAFAQLDQISMMEAEGKITARQADEKRDVWNSVLIFYPSFQRAWRQYERIQDSGGVFIYDTGYLYLFGILGKGFLMELFLFSIGILLMFGNVVPMEYQNKTNLLICPSEMGMKKVIWRKAWLCVLTGICLPVCIWSFHWWHLRKDFSFHYVGSSIHGIYQYQSLPVNVPIWLFALAAVGVQILVCSFLALAVLFLSCWRKNFMQTILMGAVVFVVPLALYMQGFEFMGYLTVYPLYRIFAG